jgi:hypothetical protein
MAARKEQAKATRMNKYKKRKTAKKQSCKDFGIFPFASLSLCALALAFFNIELMEIYT